MMLVSLLEKSQSYELTFFCLFHGGFVEAHIYPVRAHTLW
ncbi:hypothetical protein QSI_0711 [Clostridioides difficile P28]|nr:hypothetical protein QSI_0711 [Clostridioides difficile P28]